MTISTTRRRDRVAASSAPRPAGAPAAAPIRVNIVRLVPGRTRLPVAADPDVELAVAA